MSVREIAANWNGRPTFCVINLDALADNIRTIRESIHPNTQLMAVVKANAYGHGAVPTAKTVLKNGADRVAVATVDEGAELRRAGVTAPILVLGPIGAAERERAINMDMQLVVNDPRFVEGLANMVSRVGRKQPLGIHLKVDTGMRRFGVLPKDALAAARAIVKYPQLKLEGLMTHLASADMPSLESTHRQIELFDETAVEIEAAGISIPIKHVCNSAATVQFPEYHKDMVRTGLATYGIRPAPHIPLPGEPGAMRQVMTMYSMVTRVIPMEPGDRVSYGGTWQANDQSHGALVPIGYADGYLRSASNRGWMAINGNRAAVIGRVCMDQTILHLPKDVVTAIRHEVVIYGDGTPETPNAPTIEEAAELAGTIPHELLTGIAPRVPRLYMRDSKLVAVSDLEGYREL